MTRNWAGFRPDPGDPRDPWNRKDAQPCSAFQTKTGIAIASASAAATYGAGSRSQRRRPGARITKAASPTTLSAALYFESPATPNPAPAASQRSQTSNRAGRLAEEQPRQRPDGGGQAEQERTVRDDPRSRRSEKERGDVQGEDGDEARTGAEQVERQPIEDPSSRCEERDERHTRSNAFAEPAGSEMGHPLVKGGVVEIGEIQGPRDRERIALVDSRSERAGKDEPRSEKDPDDSDRAAMISFSPLQRPVRSRRHQSSRRGFPDCPRVGPRARMRQRPPRTGAGRCRVRSGFRASRRR